MEDVNTGENATNENSVAVRRARHRLRDIPEPALHEYSESSEDDFPEVFQPGPQPQNQAAAGISEDTAYETALKHLKLEGPSTPEARAAESPTYAGIFPLVLGSGFQVCVYQVKVRPQQQHISSIYKFLMMNEEALGLGQAWCLLSDTVLLTPRQLTVESIAFPYASLGKPRRLHMMDLKCQHKVEQSVFKPRLGDYDVNVLDALFERIIMDCMDHCVRMDRHYVSKQKVTENLPDFLEVSRGLTFSVVGHDGDAVMKLEPVLSMMDKRNMLTRFQKLQGDAEDNPEEYQNLCKKLMKGMLVVSKSENKTYPVKELLFHTTSDSTFLSPYGRLTYQQFYELKYGDTVDSPNQPMLVSYDSPDGSTYPRTCLIPELCFEFKRRMVTSAEIQFGDNATGWMQHHWDTKMQKFMRMMAWCCRWELAQWKVSLLDSPVPAQATNQ